MSLVGVYPVKGVTLSGIRQVVIIYVKTNDLIMNNDESRNKRVNVFFLPFIMYFKNKPNLLIYFFITCISNEPSFSVYHQVHTNI